MSKTSSRWICALSVCWSTHLLKHFSSRNRYIWSFLPCQGQRKSLSSQNWVFFCHTALILNMDPLCPKWKLNLFLFVDLTWHGTITCQHLLCVFIWSNNDSFPLPVCPSVQWPSICVYIVFINLWFTSPLQSDRDQWWSVRNVMIKDLLHLSIESVSGFRKCRQHHITYYMYSIHCIVGKKWVVEQSKLMLASS